MNADSTARFTGKVALVTGAASGIGRATAQRLWSEGASVFGVDRSSEGLASLGIELGPERFASLVADLTEPGQCTASVDACITRFGRLDSLGNVAGISRAERFEDISADGYRQMMAVNFEVPLFLTQAALPHLKATGGNVVNIASMAGLIGQAYTLVYCASKAAVVAMTKSLAMELLREGVRVNAIAPGSTATPLAESFQLPEGIDFDLVKRYIPLSPRTATAEDVASLFAYLASDEARSIHGAVISVDNGATAG